jgi:site-specific DNA-adenine methylase
MSLQSLCEMRSIIEENATKKHDLEVQLTSLKEQYVNRVFAVGKLACFAGTGNVTSNLYWLQIREKLDELKRAADINAKLANMLDKVKTDSDLCCAQLAELQLSTAEAGLQLREASSSKLLHRQKGCVWEFESARDWFHDICGDARSISMVHDLVEENTRAATQVSELSDEINAIKAEVSKSLRINSIIDDALRLFNDCELLRADNSSLRKELVDIGGIIHTKLVQQDTNRASIDKLHIETIEFRTETQTELDRIALLESKCTKEIQGLTQEHYKLLATNGKMTELHKQLTEELDACISQARSREAAYEEIKLQISDQEDTLQKCIDEQVAAERTLRFTVWHSSTERSDYELQYEEVCRQLAEMRQKTVDLRASISAEAVVRCKIDC